MQTTFPRKASSVARLTIERIERDFANRISVRALAASHGVQPCQFIRSFRQVVGISPYAYLLRYRVRRAQQMLSAGSSITQAAFACGFSDQPHLTRLFKREFGVSPGEYIRLRPNND